MVDPLEQLRNQLHGAEQIIADLQAGQASPGGDFAGAPVDAVDQLRSGRRNLRDLNDNFEEEIANIVEREQRRIARDLHDSLGSLLTAIDLRLSTLRQDVKAGKLPDPDGIDLISGLCREAITRSRTLTRGLFPVGEDPEELGRALADLVDSSDERFPLRCRFSYPRTISIRSPKVANQLYRIAQEATANAARHGGAQELVVALVKRRGELLLSVEDDGCGFDPAADSAADSRGLRIMRYRATTIGADFVIDSQPGNGTRIICRLSLSTLINADHE